MELELQALARQLQTLKSRNTVNIGKHLHAFFLKKGVLKSTLSVFNRLLQMYSRSGPTMTDARKLFDEMQHRNCFSWNTMIEAYIKRGDVGNSLDLFYCMPDKSEYSWDVVVYGLVKLGEMDIARRVFYEMGSVRKGVALNVMVNGYVKNGNPREALSVFKEMGYETDGFVLASVVRACVDLGNAEYGKQVHARVFTGGVEFDSVLASSLVNMYAKCGLLERANRVFDMMDEVDDFSISALIYGYVNCGRMSDARKIFNRKINTSVVVWNSLISGCVTNNEETEGYVLFNEMRNFGIREDSSTIASILGACSSLGDSQCCRQIHADACKLGLLHDVFVASAFIDAYSKSGCASDDFKLFSELKAYDTVLLNSMITVYSNCGRIEDARQIFTTMPNRSLISWNSMITGFSQNGCSVEALHLFCEMNALDLRTDTVSLAAVISSSASVSSVELGEQVFARAMIIGLESDQVVATSLVDFYCKCGLVDNARKIFDAMTKCDEISWNSMLMGYATNGHGLQALSLFNEMLCSGQRPNEITFVAILSACSHCGLVKEGWKWFDMMKCDYHINPGIEHYSCMIDLLARSGCLMEAMDLVERMPFEADASLWSAVLRGCVAYEDKDLAERVAKRIIELDSESSGAYVQLSTIFASSGDWESSTFIRKLMRWNRVDKVPGCSWG